MSLSAASNPIKQVAVHLCHKFERAPAELPSIGLPTCVQRRPGQLGLVPGCRQLKFQE